MPTAETNTQWICRVREALAEGLGVEDIALRLSCAVEDVRREVEILRETDNLGRLYERSEA
jgi:DNA-binding NarL/FixJ family response regulator